MPRTFATSKLSNHNQTVIPKRVRKLMGLAEGSVIRYERDGPAMKITRLDLKKPNPCVNFREWSETANDQTSLQASLESVVGAEW